MRIANVAGHTWHIVPLDVPEQIEVEVMLVRLFAPSAAHALGAAVEGLAPALVDILRSVAGEGDGFDLSKLLTLWSDDDEDGLDTRDPRIAAAWTAMLDALSVTLGDLVQRAIPAMSDRVDLADAQRLIELAVLRHAHPMIDGRPQRLADWAALSRILATAGPSAKWHLLREALLATYGPAVEPAEAEGE